MTDQNKKMLKIDLPLSRKKIRLFWWGKLYRHKPINTAHTDRTMTQNNEAFEIQVGYVILQTLNVIRDLNIHTTDQRTLLATISTLAQSVI